MPDQSISGDLGCTRQLADRARVNLVCEARQGMRAWQKVTLEDISQAGFRMVWHPGCREGTPLRIRIPGLQILTAHIRWQQQEAIGCEFAERLHVAVFEHIVRQAQLAA